MAEAQIPTGLTVTDKSKELEVILQHFDKTQREQFKPLLEEYKKSQSAQKMMNKDEFRAFAKLTIAQTQEERSDVQKSMDNLVMSIDEQSELLNIQTTQGEKLSDSLYNMSSYEESSNKLLEGLGDKLSSGFEKVGGTAFDALLGPLNMAMSPLSDLFGVDLKQSLLNIPKSIGGVFGKKEDSQDTIADIMKEEAKNNEKTKPNASSLLKSGGAIGAVGVFLGKIFKGGGDTPDDEGSGLLGGLLRNTSLGKSLV